MSNASTGTLISKIWNYGHTPRNVGLSEYHGQLTFLLFLKMADEYAGPPTFPKRTISRQW